MNNEKRPSITSEKALFNQDFKFRRNNDKALTNISSGREIWYFKNEILKDMKNLEKSLTDKFAGTKLGIKEEIDNLNEGINSLNIKLKELSTKIAEDKSIQEKIKNLENVKAKILDNILVNDVRVNTLDREIHDSISHMNTTLKETVIYAGVIGPSCKYKTFHDFIDHVINELNILTTFKEKNMLDITSFKKKIETNVQGFKMQLDSFGRSSTQFTNDSFNRMDKTMNELFHKCKDEIDEIKSKYDEKFRQTEEKIDIMEIKIIKEIDDIKEKISTIENNFNSHMKHYFNLKENFNKLNENVLKKSFSRNSVIHNFEGSNTNINFNKNKIKKRRSLLMDNKNEEIKNNNTHDNSKNENKLKDLYFLDNNNKNDDSVKNNLNKVKNDEFSKKSNDNSDLSNLNQNLKINEESSNPLKLVNLYKLTKKVQKKEIDLKNSFDFNKRSSLLSRLDIEEKKQKSFSPKRKSIKIKNIKNTFNISHLNHSVESNNSKISLQTNDINLNNLEKIKPINILNKSLHKTDKIDKADKIDKTKKPSINQNLKTPRIDKNIFNKNIHIFKEKFKPWSHNKAKRNIKRQNSLNGINNLNIENNNKIRNILNERYNMNYQKTSKPSLTKFKDIILTMEGTKKMIYETKDFKKGKNLYHIETISDKNTKKSYLRERLESCRSYLMIKNYKNNLNSYFTLGKDEPFNLKKYKNQRALLLNKSESSKVYLKNKNSLDYEYKMGNMNNLSPSFNVTKYIPPKKNQTKNKTFEEKSLQT